MQVCNRPNMRAIVALLAALLGSAIVAAHGYAEEPPIIVEVWPGEVAGDHGNIPPERIRDANDAPTLDATWITNVSRPSITVFRPSPEMNSGTALIICPGGGYWNLAWDKEGEEVAKWANALGMTGIVLKYRVPRRAGEPEPLPAPGPLLDALRAVRLVRSRAKDWKIDPNRIGVIGFSAGGHLAVMTSISFQQQTYPPIDAVDQESSQPNFAIIAYPGYILSSPTSSQLADSIRIPPETCPMFIVHASDDDEPGAQPQQSLALYAALHQAKIPVELHIYEEGKHGFGVRSSELPIATWPHRCAEWLQRHGFLNKQSP